MCQRQTLELKWNPGFATNSKKELIFLSSVNGLIEARSTEGRGRYDLRPYAGSQAQAAKIERKTVADVNCGCGAQFLP